jgi:hypothetical protein
MTKQRLKGNVAIRTKADAGVRLDEYLAQHPELSETEVTAAALNWYLDMKADMAAAGTVIEAEKLEQPTVLTPG